MTVVTAAAHICRMEPKSRRTARQIPGPGESLGDLYPHLVPEFHPTLNGDLTIFDLKPAVNRKLWWVCTTHGDFHQAPYNRIKGQQCPLCGQRKNADNRRKPKKGQSLGDRHPHLVSEFHPTLNGELTIFDVNAGSEDKLWWRCEIHGDFEQPPRTRSRGNGCYPCGVLKAAAARRTPAPGRSLGDLYPLLAREFHPTLNGNLTAYNIRPGSNAKHWWACPIHGDFEQKVVARAISGKGCPPCGILSAAAKRRKPKPGQSLGDVHPQLVSQFLVDRNEGLTAFDVKPKSEFPMWWICPVHGDFEATPHYMTTRRGCDKCASAAAAMGHGLMTKKRLIDLLESFRDGLESFSLSQAQMLTLGVQAGVAKNSAFMQVVNCHGIKALDEAVRTLGGDDTSDCAIDLTEADEGKIPDSLVLSGAAQLAPTGSDPSTAPSAGGSTAIDGLLPFFPDAAPIPKPGPVLRNAGALLAACDADAAKYLVASSVEQLWKAAYRDPEHSDSETSNVRENKFEEQVRAAFRAEFDAARGFVPTAEWSFRPLGPGTPIEQPLLMQAHVATQLADRRRIGNWSGTGAGKTVSAVLGARLIDAGFGDGVVLVVCPNNTIAGWESTILNCYPDSRIAAGGLEPVWETGTGPRWLVVSFDSLSQPRSAEQVSQLLDRNDIRLDMVAVDEIHLVKLRGSQGQRNTPAESKRRTNLKAILSGAAAQKSDLAVLGMSATPLINDLTEARSVLELISGHVYPELDTFPNIQNCLKLHQQFVLAGTRFMPDYEAELERVTAEVDCDDLVKDILTLGFKASPAAVERILLSAKLPVIVDECLQAKQRGQKTFVYTHFVSGITTTILEALEARGLAVGVFTGGNKDGLARFTGKNSDGTLVPAAERIDVLIGSSAIATGVDGLQHVTDTLVFAALPWTAAEQEQVIGRVHRTGQRSDRVRVVTPVTVARSHVIPDAAGGTPWSWCLRRLGILTFKQSVADAVLEGVIAKSLPVSPRKASEAILKWIHRLENQGDYAALRPSNYEKAA